MSKLIEIPQRYEKGLSHKRDKPLFLCFFFGSISETDFKYSTLKEFILFMGQPLFHT